MHSYLQLVLDKFDCYGTWLPGTNVYVGEIGKLIGGGSFSHTGDITDRTQETPPTITPVKEPPQQVMTGATASRAAGLSVSVGEILQALSDVSASVTLKMANRNSAALILEEVTRHQFSDERVIRKLMETMLGRGLIDPDEVVVTYVLQADSGLAAASSASEASAEGQADAEVGVGEFTLGKVKGRLAVVSGEMSETMAVAEEGRPLTPMYRALVFRGNRKLLNMFKKHYTVEALIKAASSLRALNSSGRGQVAAQRSAIYATGLPRRGELFRSYHVADDLVDIVSSSLPSLALAQQALDELTDAGLPTAVLESTLGIAPRLDVGVSALRGEVGMVELYNNLGQVLQAQGDLAGAQQQYERAVAWAETSAGGEWADEPLAGGSEVAPAAPTADEAEDVRRRRRRPRRPPPSSRTDR